MSNSYIPEVIVYTKPRCKHCQDTKRMFNQLGVEYEEVDVTTSQIALARIKDDWGFTQAPVIEVQDFDVWSGFNPDKIREAAKFLAETTINAN